MLTIGKHCTSLIQPLDVCVFRGLKEALRGKEEAKTTDVYLQEVSEVQTV